MSEVINICIINNIHFISLLAMSKTIIVSKSEVTIFNSVSNDEEDLD